MKRKKTSSMTEARVREICRNNDGCTYEEMRQADEWIRAYALVSLASHLQSVDTSKAISDYVLLMARAHYGSMETDAMLTAHKCYPEWL